MPGSPVPCKGSSSTWSEGGGSLVRSCDHMGPPTPGMFFPCMPGCASSSYLLITLEYNCSNLYAQKNFNPWREQNLVTGPPSRKYVQYYSLPLLPRNDNPRQSITDNPWPRLYPTRANCLYTLSSKQFGNNCNAAQAICDGSLLHFFSPHNPWS